MPKKMTPFLEGALSSFLLMLLFLLLLPSDGVLGESGGRGFEPEEH